MSILKDFLRDGDTAFERRIERLSEPAAKTCAVCGASFSRKPTEVRNHYAKRSTCSQGCLRALRLRPQAPHSAPPKRLAQQTCPVCGVVYSQRPGEADSRFRLRVTCSRRCASFLRWQGRRAGPQEPDPSDEEIDRRAEIILARIAEQRAA
jgi:hypothetical protein